MLNFTIGTDGALFFTFLFVVDRAQMYFVRVPIKFIGGTCFFTPVTPSIRTYSIEIELVCYVDCGFFLGALCYVPIISLVEHHLLHGVHIIVDGV